MNKKIIHALLTLILFSSCSNEKVVFERNNYKIIFNSSDNKYTGFRYYSGGSVEVEEELDQEYRVNGVVNNYYENGGLRLQETFKDGIKQGRETAYYPTGIKQYKGQNYSASKDSVWYWYRDDLGTDEKLLAIENYSKGKLFGSQVRFDNVGKSPSVKFYSFDGLLGIFKIDESDSENKIVEGELAYCMYNRNSFQVGDTFDLSIFLGHGIDTKIDVKLKLYDANIIENEISPSIIKVHDYMSKANWTYQIMENKVSNLVIEIFMSEKDEILYQSNLKLPLVVE